MVEGARLESVYTGNRIEGSNPAPSARPARQALGENSRDTRISPTAHGSYYTFQGISGNFTVLSQKAQSRPYPGSKPEGRRDRLGRKDEAMAGKEAGASAS